MKKIYIAGCGGMLGEGIYKQFKNEYNLKCTDKDANEDWISFLDFRDYESYQKDVTSFQPDYLFHLGALTDLEFCEDHPDETYLTNTLAVENAVNISQKLDIPLLYISTAGIFDGSKEEYDEWDTPNPLSVYARSKYLGERHVVENASKYLICRAGWMMGGGPGKDKKFVQKIMKQLKDGQKELFIVDDKVGSPTYTLDFAENIKLLLEKEYWGLYNMTCSGQTNRLEITMELLNILGLRDSVQINSVGSDYFKSIYYAKRPSSERLISKKLNLRKINLMRDWKDALKAYIDSYYTNYLQERVYH